MRIVHLTDLHVQVRPPLRALAGKRLIGSTNLYLLGRHAKFNPEVQAAVVAAAEAQDPDLVILTGDLSAQALPEEFEAARALLAPLLARPCVILPGNHDTYVRESAPAAAMRAVFGPWMGDQSPWLYSQGEVACLVLETCRPHPLSRGHAALDEIEAARRLLATNTARFTFLCVHYPVRGRHGQPYGPYTRALANARAVEALVTETGRVDAVLHGHEHHGYRTTLPSARGTVPILNPGSCGYAWLPKQGRGAHFNVYEVDDGQLRSVERFQYDGDGFVPEPRGAYATGR